MSEFSTWVFANGKGSLISEGILTLVPLPTKSGKYDTRYCPFLTTLLHYSFYRSRTQFYVQLDYKPHFGPNGQVRAVRKKSGFEFF